MKKIIYILLLLCCLVCFSCVNKQPRSLEVLYSMNNIDSAYCYKHHYKPSLAKTVMIRDRSELNKIFTVISKSHPKRVYGLPPYYGKITIFSDGDSLSFDIHGDCLRTKDGELSLVYETNMENFFNSLILKDRND